MGNVTINALLGHTLTNVEGKIGGDKITFTCADGSEFTMFHEQDCCESVNVEDICGDLSDLIGSPIVQADEFSQSTWPDGIEMPEYVNESYTWTFYRLATNKGTVVIRWYGSSNGYYGESVDFIRTQEATAIRA